jgi:hypothetical protein
MLMFLIIATFRTQSYHPLPNLLISAVQSIRILTLLTQDLEAECVFSVSTYCTCCVLIFLNSLKVLATSLVIIHL